jgi:hypothetical protein
MSEKKKVLNRSVPGKLFQPKFKRTQRQSSAYLNKPENKLFKFKEFKDTNLYSTSSYRYGDKDYIVSTQQANVDFSKFENHTFFHSAVANVNEAFDRIVNFYPFDGTKKSIETFEDTLTGFEKYILNSFPKNIGYLIFSGTVKGETSGNGTSIEAVDRSGAAVNSISNDRSSNLVLDPKEKPFMIEFFLNSPDKVNDNQVIVQKRSALANNFTIALSASNSATSASIIFGITSGSNYSYVTGSIEKGKFNHISAIYDKLGDRKTKLIIDDKIYSSSLSTVFESINTYGESFFIGKGSQVRLNNELFDPQETLSGSLDSLRFYHEVKSDFKIKEEKTRDVYASDSLRLNYTFNEPFGDYIGNNIVMDRSGNSLHAKINNFNYTVNRATGSDVPATNEDLKRNVVLFPDFTKTKTLNTNLLTTGSEYDEYNPNLITKLIPPHYFEEGNHLDNFENELGKLGETFSSITDNNVGKKQTEIPGAQLLVKFLLVWGKFFDEMKTTIDTLSNSQHVEYYDHETAPDVFLERKARLNNIPLPSLFRNANMSQIIDGINLNQEYANSIKSLNEIQNLIWRRILSDITNYKTSKGTIDSIKGIFRSTGIEPDNIFTFREYGGSKKKSLEGSRELKREVVKFLNFSGSIDQTISSVDLNGYPPNFPKIKSAFLSGSRKEVGVPNIKGTMVQKSSENIHGISNESSDGLFTSGSFTYECLYSWAESSNSGNIRESIVRMHTTGSTSPSTKESCILNLTAKSGSIDLYVRDNHVATAIKHLSLTGVDIFDNDVWYLSFGRKASHDLDGSGRSAYFLRSAKQKNGEIISFHQTSSHYANDNNSLFNSTFSSHNASGSFLVIGKQNFQNGGSGLFLNDTSVSSDAQETNFTGLMTNARFWSKYTTDIEWKERAKNYASVGIENPSINYNFTPNLTGSFERLILQTDYRQHTTGSDVLGNISLFDFSQNNIHFEGSNFEKSKIVFSPQRVDYEVLSDNFDVNIAKNKVRVRSFQNLDLITDSSLASISPIYEVNPSEEVFDDNRFSIDMSVMKGLNENILSMFANFSSLDDALGKPNLIFSDTYPKLIEYRKNYFHNVLEKIDLLKYRNLFKWIDNSFTDIIYSSVPRSTNYLGINFIYESHVLERNRFKYLFDEIYLKALPRETFRGNLLLSQFVGKLKKH